MNFRWFTAPIKLLDDASYALYLFHPMFAAVILIFWMDGPFGMNGLRYYPMKTILALGAGMAIIWSITVHLVFERRATRFARKRAASSAAPMKPSLATSPR